MKGMKFTKKVKRILALTFVFSILQNHLLILSNVSNRVYATSTSLETTASEDEKKNEKTTSQSNANTSVNSVLSDIIDDSDDAPFDPRVDQLRDNKGRAAIESKRAVETKETVDESTKEEDQVEEEPVETETEVETEVSSEVGEAEEEEDVEEKFKAKLEIQNSYEYSDGVILEGVITLDVANLNGYIESADYEIALEEIEGYTVKSILVENVETFEEESDETHATKDNTITGRVTYDGVSNTAKYEIKATFVLEGTGDFDDISLNANEIIVHEDKSVYEDEFSASSMVELKGDDLETNYSLTTENNSIYKGYLYANCETDTEYKTTYNSTSKIELKDIENVSYILVSESKDILVDDKDEEFTLAEVNQYSKTFIDTEEFEKLFGEDGYIEIYSNGKLLGRIDSANEVKDGHYEYTYNEPISNAEFKIVGLKDTGTLDIKSDKVINDSPIFATEKVKSFKAIKQASEFKKINTLGEEEYVLEEKTAENKINLEETESKISISLDNETLSSSSVNETSMLLELRTDEEKYNLFKNPTIKIEFPSDVKSIEIEKVNLLYKNGLSLDKYDLVEENGKQVLNISLLGTQTEYTSGLLNRGTSINIDFKIKLDRLTTNKYSLIKMTYTNEIGNAISYEKAGNSSEELEVNYVTKMGLLKTLSVSNNLTGETSMIYDNENDDTQLAMDATGQVIDFKGVVVNNYDTEINNMVIVGKIPGPGVQDGNRNDLVSTFDASLKEEILTNGLSGEVYYSEKINPDKDDSSWEQATGNVEKYNSFKIVLNNSVVNQGERIEFSYKVSIPDNISYNQKGYTTYTIYYEIDGSELFAVCSGRLKTEEKELTLEDLEEQEIEVFSNLSVGSQVTVGDKVLTENDTINEGQLVKYTLIVTNNATTTATNVKVSASAENANLYYNKKTHYEDYQNSGPADLYEYTEDTEGEHLTEEFTIDNLAAGESKTFTYQAVVKNISDIQGETSFGKIDISADNMDTKHVETIKNKVVDADIQLITRYAFTEFEDDVIQSKRDCPITIDVKNMANDTLNNVIVMVHIPKTLEIREDFPVTFVGSDEIDYDYELSNMMDETILKIKINELVANKKVSFQLETKVSRMDKSMTDTLVEIYATSEFNGVSYTSNKYSRKAYQSETTILYDWTADRESGSTVKDNDIINFELKIKNDGIIDSGELDFNSTVPKGFDAVEIEIERNGSKEHISGSDFPKIVYKAIESMHPSEEIDIRIQYVVRASELSANENIIENNAVIVGSSIDKITTDVISYNVDGILTSVSTTKRATTKTHSHSHTEGDEEEEVVIKRMDPNSEPVLPANATNVTVQNAAEVKETPEFKYNISGCVWEDSNKNGIKDANETPLYGIGAFAYKINDSGKTENNVATAVTDEKGNYNLKDIPKGNYVIVFGYDSSMYNVTTYKSAKAKSFESSDAIFKKMSDDSKVAMTDVITVNDKSISNINLGLFKINGFDMKLDKYISKVTVNNSRGKQETQFTKDDSIAKIEIHSKVFENSSVDVEYKIAVKNEGTVDGYVNRIVDYLPKGLTFDQEKNPDWVQNGDQLVYAGLSNRKIAGGREAEVTLVLSKTVDSYRTNSYVNAAEIMESTNDIGLTDNDSTNNNQNKLEDDYDSITLLVTVSTGATINRILIIIAIISVVGVVIASRLVFRKKFYR